MPIRGTPLSLIDWQVLAEVEVEENCDYVDFTGLDINRDWEYYLDAIIKNPTTSISDYYLFIEGDYTNGNYLTQYISCSSTTASVDRIPYSFMNSVRSGRGSLTNVKITKDPYGYFRFISLVNRNTGSYLHLALYAGSKTAPVSNITSLRVAASVSGAIGAGSRFILARPRS